jgi:metal-responsive CopG/Arc/MetJ family transcriptional regulator
MLDALKSLFENNVVSEEIRADIEAAWNNKIQENRELVTQQLREEFAQKYEHDKSVMIEAIDTMIADRLSAEIQEFTEDRKQLAEAKAKYAVAIREHSSKLNDFVLKSLAKEVTELHSDQKVMAENFAKLEEFVVEALAKEIADFYEDKKDLAETKVRLVKEAKEQFAILKGKFVKQTAGLVESVVSQGLTKEIKQLKEDIDSARQNDFGRKIFEAFTAEYQNSLLSEKSETAKLLKVIAEKDQALAEARNAITEKQALVESKEQEVARAKAIAERKEVMSELLNPLSKDQKEIMSELLESVQTVKLRSSFDKYLPAVLSGSTPEKKKALVEAKEITGNKESNSISSATSQAEVIDIRRLAGIK